MPRVGHSQWGEVKEMRFLWGFMYLVVLGCCFFKEDNVDLMHCSSLSICVQTVVNAK